MAWGGEKNISFETNEIKLKMHIQSMMDDVRRPRNDPSVISDVSVQISSFKV